MAKRFVLKCAICTGANTMTKIEDVVDKFESYVRKRAKTLGQEPDIEVIVRDEGDKTVLYWEAGPEYWALKVTGEQSIFGNKPMYDSFPEIPDDDSIWVECKNSFAIEFGTY